jgi:hypothetical protein
MFFLINLKWIVILLNIKLKIAHISKNYIFYFLSLKYQCKKTFYFKNDKLKHIKIKIVIIIVLKLNQKVDSGQNPSHEWEEISLIFVF